MPSALFTRESCSLKAGLLLGLLAVAVCAKAETPVLEHLYPAGGAINSTNTVTINGKFEPWPPNVWVSSPDICFTAQTDKGKFDVTIAPDAAPGPRWVRLFNENGASEPRLFVVGEGPEILEQEPNDHFAGAQPIESLPVTVNGQLDPRGDVDSFAISLQAGQWIEARLDAYTLMSKLDAVLRIVNKDGRQLAWNHDYITLDPRVVWQATEDKTVVVQVFGFAYPANAQVRLTGGAGCVYRLHLTVSDVRPADPIPLPDTNAEEIAAPTEEPLPLPARVEGLFAVGAETHQVRFTARKGEVIDARVEAAIHGSPLDAWLSIHDEAGKELARNDDAGGLPDPRLEWTAPDDGVFLAKVGSVTHRGGPAYRYRLILEPAPPDFTAHLSTSSTVIEAGSTQEVKVAVTRLRGLTNELTLHWQGLPEGITGDPVTVPEDGGEVTLSLSACEQAESQNLPVMIQIRNGSEESRPVPFDLTGSSSNNGVPGGYQKLLKETIEQFWVTVHPQPPAEEDAPVQP